MIDLSGLPQPPQDRRREVEAERPLPPGRKGVHLDAAQRPLLELDRSLGPQQVE